MGERPQGESGDRPRDWPAYRLEAAKLLSADKFRCFKCNGIFPVAQGIMVFSRGDFVLGIDIGGCTKAWDINIRDVDGEGVLVAPTPHNAEGPGHVILPNSPEGRSTLEALVAGRPVQKVEP